jgi:hypothetical protein
MASNNNQHWKDIPNIFHLLSCDLLLHFRFYLVALFFLLNLLLKANRNKNYFVVKTFGLPLVHKSGGIFI